MQLSFEGNAHLLGRLAWRSLVGMGMSNVEVIDANRGVTVAGRKPRRNSCIGGLVKKHAGAICVQEIESSYRREKKRVSPVDKNTVTPSLVPVYV